jgi:hypothetical protein
MQRSNSLSSAINLHKPASECRNTGVKFKELRGVLNDAHKHIVAVSKALKIPTR